MTKVYIKCKLHKNEQTTPGLVKKSFLNFYTRTHTYWGVSYTHRSDKNKQGGTNNKKWQPPLKSRNFQFFNFYVNKQLNIPIIS